MKNIETILQELGIELTEEQKTSLNDEVKNNYKTVAEFNGQKKKLDSANEQISSLQNEFDTFKQSMNGADPKDMQTKLNEYETKLANQKSEYENKLNLLTLNGQLREKANEFVADTKNYITSKIKTPLQKQIIELQKALISQKISGGAKSYSH